MALLFACPVCMFCIGTKEKNKGRKKLNQSIPKHASPMPRKKKQVNRYAENRKRRSGIAKSGRMPESTARAVRHEPKI
jgi:hypothetical protein